MLDYPALRALAAVVRTGSFERAAGDLHVTPSAVSQRVRQLEERVGAVLVERGQPCRATETGARLCRHMEQIGLLEADLFRHLPNGAGEEAGAPRVTLPVATSADSLGTWFLKAAARFSTETGHLLDMAVDDQDHTADWLRRGRVLAAVTALARPVQGCRSLPLGSLRYLATASPEFAARHFSEGVTPRALASAPALTFNQKDRLQADWLKRAFGRDIAHPTHWLPSTQGFVEAALLGMGWGLNPVQLVEGHLKAGRLVELLSGAPLDVPLHWQVSRLGADPLQPLTRAVVEVARSELVPAE